MSGPVRIPPSYFTILFLVTLAGCSLIPESDQSLQDTKTAINIQQTKLANQILTATAEQSGMPTAVVPVPTSPPPSEEAPTQAATTPGGSSPGSMQAMMKSAKILLYEDMVAFPDTTRYVRDTLEYMDIPYVDVGNAIGELKTQLMSYGPDGKGWDLVILAAEAKPEIQGELFTYIDDLLEKDSSVILEVWYLDKVAGGTASALLARCGVAFEKDWRNVSPNGMIMFPLDSSNPVLQEPNSGLTFTKVTSYWWDPVGDTQYDIGDLMKITGGGDAKLLIGISPRDTTIHGTSTVCINGRLILQTFSSHQLTYNAMRPLWENYIYNTLKVRFSGGS